jgi:hypothetical protein
MSIVLDGTLGITTPSETNTGTLSVTGVTTLTGGLNAALPVLSGGTGLATLTANNVILGAGTSTPTFVAPSTNGNYLTSNGTTWVSQTPAASGVTTGKAIALAMIFGF